MGKKERAGKIEQRRIGFRAPDYSKKIGKKYQKNNKEIYKELVENGDEKLAISIIKKKYEKYLNDGIKKPSEMKGVSKVYKLLEDMGDKVSNK